MSTFIFRFEECRIASLLKRRRRRSKMIENMDELEVKENQGQQKLEGVRFETKNVANGVWTPNKLRLLGKLNPLQKTWVEGTYTQTTNYPHDPEGKKSVRENFRLFNNGNVFHDRDVLVNGRLTRKYETEFVGLEGTVLNVKDPAGKISQVLNYQSLSRLNMPPPESK